MKIVGQSPERMRRIEVACAKAAIDVRQVLHGDALAVLGDGDLDLMVSCGLVETQGHLLPTLTPRGLHWISRQALDRLIAYRE